MSCAALSKSRIGRGIPANVYDYHCKVLADLDLIEVSDHTPQRGREIHYRVTDQLTQPLVDAAALTAISGVLEDIPEPLAQWFEKPYIDDIHGFVRAAGRSLTLGES